MLKDAVQFSRMNPGPTVAERPVGAPGTLEPDDVAAPMVRPLKVIPGAGKLEEESACPNNPEDVPLIHPLATEVGATSPRKVIEVSEVQEAKASIPMVVTPLGIVMDESPEQYLNV